MGYRDKDVLEELYVSEGLTQTEIADKFGVSPGTISRWINRFGIDTGRGGPWTDKDVLQTTMEQYDTLTQVAEHFDISDGTLCYYLDKYEIEYELNHRKYADEELLSYLREHTKNDYNPTMRDFSKNDNLPSPDTYQDRFGSWSKSLDRAGIDYTPNRADKYDIEEVRNLIHEKISSLDEVTIKNLSSCDGVPSPQWITENIGTRSEIYKEFDVPEEKEYSTQQYSKEKVLSEIKNINGPVSKDKIKNQSNISSSTVYNHFNSIKEGCERANKEHSGGQKYTDEELLDKMEECYNKYGTIKVGLFKEDEDLPSYFVYIHRFGSWSNAKKLAGFEQDISSSGSPKENIPEDKYTHRYTTKFLNVREKVRKRDNNSCRICGRGKEELGRAPDTHHISWDFEDPDDAHTKDNLILLCKKHHAMVESGDIEHPHTRRPLGVPGWAGHR